MMRNFISSPPAPEACVAQVEIQHKYTIFCERERKNWRIPAKYHSSLAINAKKSVPKQQKLRAQAEIFACPSRNNCLPKQIKKCAQAENKIIRNECGSFVLISCPVRATVQKKTANQFVRILSVGRHSFYFKMLRNTTRVNPFAAPCPSHIRKHLNSVASIPHNDS